MLASIKNFFQQQLAMDATQAQDSVERRSRLAAAALLIEVVRADEQFTAEERSALLSGLAEKFALDAEAAQQLLSLAEDEAHEAIDLYQFTSEINRHFTAEQKVWLVEQLWRAAYADQVLHYREEHLIRRIGELIHVPHSAFIAAKLRVQAASR